MSRPELLRSLAALAQPAPSPHLAALVGLKAPFAPDDHVEVFLLETHPYASVHLGAEGMIGGEAFDRVAGFWRALGLVPPCEADGLAVLLELYAGLVQASTDGDGPRRDAMSRARWALFWEHLAPWAFVYLESVRRLRVGFYVAWADLLSEALAAEAAELDEPDALPLALRAAPCALGAHDEDLLSAAISPVRSGMVLTRSALAQAGRELNLGLRKGERRLVLKALATQDRAALFGWLACYARSWADRHRVLHDGRLEEIGAFWHKRAARAAACFEAAAKPCPT
jgi:TorA maturation chaperone TorD